MHDLSQRIEAGMQTYPGDPEVVVEPAATHATDGYRVTRLSCGTHAGTHVDAPAHTEADGRTLEDYAVGDFDRECVRVDCRDLDARDPIPVERVPAVGDGTDCVVFWTDWADHWGTERYVDHPYLSPSAAEFCAERGLAVAIDALGPDPTPSARAGSDEPDGFPAHHALLGDGNLLFENLANLGAVPDRFELRAYPLRLDADGAPVRAIGVAP